MNPMKLTPLFAAAALVLVAAASPASAFCISTSGGCLGTGTVTNAVDDATATANQVLGIAAGATDEATGLAISLLGTAIAVVGSETQDLDHDGVPDAAEPLICGNDFVYGFMNQESTPGQCTTHTDYLPPDNLRQVLDTAGFYVGVAQGVANGAVAQAQAQLAALQVTIEQTIGFGEATVGFVVDTATGAVLFAEGQADAVVGIVDADHDNVLDVLEPIICGFVENGNIPQDGSCTADNQDYTPPAL